MNGQYYVLFASNNFHDNHPLNYKVVYNFEQIVSCEITSRRNNVTTYEVLHNANRKIYLDIDAIPSYEDMLTLVKDFKDFAKISSDYVITRNDMSNHGLLSFHVIFNTYTTVSNMKNLVNNFKFTTKHKFAHCIDISVYKLNQLFRLPYQHGQVETNQHKIVYWSDPCYEKLQKETKKYHETIKKIEELGELRKKRDKKISDQNPDCKSSEIIQLTSNDEEHKRLCNEIRKLADSLNTFGETEAHTKLHKTYLIQYIEDCEPYMLLWRPYDFAKMMTKPTLGSYVAPYEQIPDLSVTDAALAELTRD